MGHRHGYSRRYMLPRLTQSVEEKRLLRQQECDHPKSRRICGICGYDTIVGNGCTHRTYAIRCSDCDKVLGSDHTEGNILIRIVL